jgi:molecular chaperone HtpG
MSGQKTMEINYQHTIIQNMLKKVQADETDKTVKDLVWLMYDSSLLTSGFTLEEPTVFASRIHRLIKLGLSIDDESDEEEDLPELEDDDAGGDNAVSEEKQEEDDSTMEQVD